MKRTRKHKNLFFAIVSLIILLLIIVCAYLITVFNTGFKLDKPAYVYIDKRKNYDKLLADLDTVAHIGHVSSFNIASSLFRYRKYMKTGCYEVKPGMTVLHLIRELKQGKQTPVKLTFNNIRTKDELALRLSSQLMLPTDSLEHYFADSAFCAREGFNVNTIVAMFIPNTYQMYWDVSQAKLFDKIHSEYNKFWTSSRKAQAESLGLSPVQISILASIVEEECMHTDEYPMVAGLYYNRFKHGHLLQADPTVKFALGDFSLRRILDKHLTVDSPYNTYKFKGLPPGPIRIPSIKAIDGVLNLIHHNYYYMCAKDDFSGYHNFATTLHEHSLNARKYQQALNKRHIYQ